MSKKILRPHQESAVKDILDTLQLHDRAQLISACGTGKTITLQAVATELGDRIAAFFPSLNLVSQTIQEWKEQYGEFRAVAVCSDETVGGSDDSARIDDSDIEKFGVEVTRDAVRLAEILSETISVPLVVFSTYHSSARVAEAQEISGIEFDLAVADEAHYLATSHTHERSGGAVLDSNMIKAKKRVFATATPKIVTLKGRQNEKMVASMDDEALFGPVAHELQLRDAIDQGLLVDYKIYIVEVSHDSVREELTEVVDDLDVKDPKVRLAMGIAAHKKARESLPINRSIIYLSSRFRARAFAEKTDSRISVITGDQPTSVREAKLKDLKEHGGAIANVRVLTEGVDVPALDAVEFVDPRSSKIDIVQAIGRAVRLDPDNPGKTVGFVILPILEEPSDEEFSSGSFKAVWEVLAQMAENDTALSKQLRNRTDYGEDGVEYPREYSTIQVLSAADYDEAGFLSESLAKKIELRAAYISEPKLNWYDTEWIMATEFKGKETILKEQKALYKMGALSPKRVEILDRDFPEWRE